MDTWLRYGYNIKKGVTAVTVTPCYSWRAWQDSNLRPTDS